MIRKAIIRQTPFLPERKAYIEKAHELLTKWTSVPVICDFIVISDFLADAELESDADLDERWIQKKLNKLQYHIVQVDMTRSEWLDLGIRQSLYGQSRVVNTRFGRQAITYGRWDKQIGALHADNLPARYQPIHPLTVGTLHEDAHALTELTGAPDVTHHFFYGEKDGKRWQVPARPEQAFAHILFYELDSLKDRTIMQLINLTDQLRTLKIMLFERQKTLLHPVEEFREYITQGYGVKNSAYSLTGVHVGHDIACPDGTPVRAPWDGKVTVAGYSKVLGNFCHYQYTYKGQQYTDRYLHLQSIPDMLHHKRGGIIGRTGNTGFSTGYHLHVDIHVNDVDLTTLNSSNWQERTVNPEKHYG